MKKTTLYIHYTCFSSYGIIKLLKALGLLHDIRLVDVGLDPGAAIKDSVISVPWLTIGGSAIATDPLEPQLVVDAVKNNDLRAYGPNSVSDAINKLKASIVASSYASCIILSHNTISPLLSCGFLEVASRIRLGRVDVEKLKGEVRLVESQILDEIRDDCVRVAAKNLVRELYWLGVDVMRAVRELDLRQVSQWLLAKSSVGRAGIPLDMGNIKSSSELILQEIKKDGQRYVDSVTREQDTISKDEEYMSVVRDLLNPPS